MTHTTSGSKDQVELSELELAALRLVHRHDGAFGRVRLAQVLAGRRTAGVLEHGLDRDAQFGAAEDLDAAAGTLDALVKRRLLAVRGTERRRPVLALADAARALARVRTGNPRQPAPARLSYPQREQLWALLRWRDLIALQEEKRAQDLATTRTLRRLVRGGPEVLDGLVAEGLIGPAPRRFLKTVLEVMQHVVAGPTAQEIAQTLAARCGDGGQLDLTPDVLEWARSPRGGITKAQLAAIGVPWPPPKDWRTQVAGRRVSLEALKHFLVESAA